MTDSRPLLFFDSGVGGLSVLAPTAKLLPQAPLVYVADSAGFPYGTRSEGEIATFCESTYGVAFPLTAKQKVIGADAHPLYKWIAAEAGEGAAPKWNFHKYLIGKDGSLLGAWPSRVRPSSTEITSAIEAAL